MDPRITAMTDAELQLSVVEKEVYAALQAQPHVYVSARQLKSGTGILMSEGFSRCQGIAYFDLARGVGALAHHYPQHSPYDTLTGDWESVEDGREDPKKIFPVRKDVIAVHQYHTENYSYPIRWIEGALNRIGIEHVLHLPIKHAKPGWHEWRSMAMDVKTGEVFVFPTDFSYGICCKLN